MNLKFLVIATSIIVITCDQGGSKSNQNISSGKNLSATNSCVGSAVFSMKDSSGTLRGPVLHFSDTSASSACGGLIVKDKAGDSITFLFAYSELQNMDLKKLSIGSCVEISYRAEIIREEGIESNRIFFITDIKYN